MTTQRDRKPAATTCSSQKEGSVLFNDALNTFYLRLYGVGHMVKDYYDSVRGNPLPPLHGLQFPISSKDSFIARVLFYAPFHRQDNTNHGLCKISNGAMAGTRGVDPITHCTITGRSTTELHLVPVYCVEVVDNLLVANHESVLCRFMFGIKVSNY